jgi:F-type H+-transporting ATPase subunit b
METSVWSDAEFWVTIAFLAFVGVMIYLGVHRKLGEALDARQARIKTELDEARRLKEEAAALLSEYQRRQQDAEREAEQIIATAQAEAERVAAEAHTKLEDFIARRSKIAEDKIAQAEVQALADVRAAAAEAAAAAAERILRQTVKGKTADDLIARSIEDVRKNLN